MRHMRIAQGGALTAALLLVGCNDSTFDLSPSLVTDTLELATPRPGNEGLPSGLDITGTGLGALGGARFPERAQDAGAWDFVVRDRDGQVVLVPSSVLGLASRAALTPPIVGETFESLDEAPGQSTFRTDTAFVLQPGQVYGTRSRLVSCGFGDDEQFGKLSPISVDHGTGRVRIAVLTNERCGDFRLVDEDED